MEEDNKFGQKLDLMKSRRREESSFGEKKSREQHAKKKEEQKVEYKESRNNSGGMGIRQASETAKEKLAEALDKKANTVVSVSKEGENWNAVIEIIDEEYLPGKNLNSMSDIIGVYEVKLSDKGELLSWNKKSSRKRGNVSV